MEMIRAALRYLIDNGLGILNLIFYKKRKTIVMSQSKSRYSGNSRWFFEYLVDNNYEVRWLYSDEKQKKYIPEKYHKKVLKRKSFKGLMYVLRSEYFFISYRSGDLGLFWHIGKRNTLTNLWHAIGIKKVALTDEKFDEKASKNHIKNEVKYYSYMIASSDLDRYNTSASQGVDVRNVLVTGTPCSDIYLNKKNKCTDKAVEKKILYAPTFRDYEVSFDMFFPFTDFRIEELVEYFSNRPDLILYLRPHPDDISSNKQAMALENKLPKNIVYFSQDVCDDIDEIIYTFDVIITDYSSIYMEPLLYGTPCIFIPIDYDKYTETRGLAYDYNTVTPGPKVNNTQDLFYFIDDALKDAPSHLGHREIVKSMFFKYTDGNSCKRICEEIIK